MSEKVKLRFCPDCTVLLTDEQTDECLNCLNQFSERPAIVGEFELEDAQTLSLDGEDEPDGD